MAFNTNNPIGSTDPRDLSDNSQNFDSALNSNNASWSDRLGVSRPTIPYALDNLNATSYRTFGSVSFMVAQADLAIGHVVSTTGYYTPGDGGGNEYEIVAGATGTADGGSFIDLDNGLQARGLFNDGIVWLRQFGADETPSNDTIAIKAIAGMGKNLTVDLGQGDYVFNESVVMDDVFLKIQGNSTSQSSIKFSPTSDTIMFDMRHTVSLAKQFCFSNLTLIAGTEGTATCLKIEAKLTSAPVQVNGQRDTLYLDHVRIVQTGSNYWMKGLHSINNGGVHANTLTIDNAIPAAQSDPNVEGVTLELNDSKASPIRSFTAVDFYIFRTANSIRINNTVGPPNQIESVYVSNGELVGISNAAFYVTGKVGAADFSGVHVDSTNKFIDSTTGELLIVRLSSCDIRKSSNGGPSIPAALFDLGSGESLVVSGCVLAGNHNADPSPLNRAFNFTASTTAFEIGRAIISGCGFKNFNSVYGETSNARVKTEANTYDDIDYAIYEGNPTSSRIETKDAQISKTLTLSLDATGSQVVSVPVPDRYFESAWPVAFLQKSSQTGSDNLEIEYQFGTSDSSSCSFLIKGNTTARPVRFSFMALGTSNTDVT